MGFIRLKHRQVFFPSRESHDIYVVEGVTNRYDMVFHLVKWVDLTFTIEFSKVRSKPIQIFVWLNIPLMLNLDMA